PKTENRNPKTENQNPKPETRNSKTENQNPKPQAVTLKCETQVEALGGQPGVEALGRECRASLRLRLGYQVTQKHKTVNLPWGDPPDVWGFTPSTPTKPQTPNPKPQTPDPKPQTPNPKIPKPNPKPGAGVPRLASPPRVPTLAPNP
ncbi:hypothetical protein T484DRAFT_1619215, partial [Baffinella frigidus]